MLNFIVKPPGAKQKHSQVRRRRKWFSIAVLSATMERNLLLCVLSVSNERSEWVVECYLGGIVWWIEDFLNKKS
jgi:hypothetical protein